jgi:antitoxin VapB
MARTAKLFKSGRSQAVRLPAAYRFDTPEVYINQDPATSDVILSRKPKDWLGLLERLAELSRDPTFLTPADRAQGHQDRDPFADGDA